MSESLLRADDTDADVVVLVGRRVLEVAISGPRDVRTPAPPATFLGLAAPGRWSGRVVADLLRVIGGAEPVTHPFHEVAGHIECTDPRRAGGVAPDRFRACCTDD